MSKQTRQRQIASLLAAAALAVFVVDLALPAGFAVGVFYLPLVAAAALLCSPAAAVALTCFYLLLMGAGPWFSDVASAPPPAELEWINRALAMVTAITMGGVLIPFRRARTALSESSVQAMAEVERLNAELEDRVQRRTEQLEVVNKELEAFTYSVSHDLRAPLRGMSGFARVLEEDYGDRLDDDGRRYLEIIKSNAAQMGQLIDDLLALSRLGRQPLKATSLSLDELARDAIREVTADEKERQIEITVGPLPTCRGDANLLRQVFVNLLSNAVKFTRHASPARVEIGSSHQNGEPVVFVRDNGAGFDMKYANKLFGVFQRLHGREDFAGTGVGLAIVKRIVDRHGGRVWAEGQPGKGATFYFTLGDCD